MPSDPHLPSLAEDRSPEGTREAPRASLGCFLGAGSDRFPRGADSGPTSVRSPPVALDLTVRAQRGLARLLPSLICGEESAAIVFGSESERPGPLLPSGGHRALERIARDEAAHERMLRGLEIGLPPAPDLAEIQRRARRFFVRVATRSEGPSHFARIAELDACVCVILGAVLAAPVARCAGVREPFALIRRDEVRHVAVSRRYVAWLGGGPDASRRAAEWVRPELVAVLAHVSDAFDDLEVDPDDLLRRIRDGAGA